MSGTVEFIILLGVINVVFFLPFYLLNVRNQPNPFHFLVDTTTTTKQKLKMPFIKFSSDPFRINMDYALLLLAFMLIGFKSPMAATVLAVLAVVTWIIIIYSGVMLYFFEHTPIIIADLKFIGTGLTILKSWKYLLFLALFLIVCLMICGMYLLSAYLMSLEPNGYLLGGGLVSLAALGLFKPGMEYNMWHQRTVLSPFLYLGINYTRTLKYCAVLEKPSAFFSAFDQYEDLELKHTPNIEMISVESYGSVVFEDEELKPTFIPLAELKLKELKQQGYHVASTYSIPPAFAGGSWLSHASMCYGINIENIHLYNLFFKTESNFDDYRSLFHFTAKEGYTNILANAIGGYRDEIDWTSVHKHYQYDKLIDAEYMDYKGHRFKFLGVGSVPPDQYSFYRISDIITKERLGPYFMFFSTLNSHTPFHSPKTIVDHPLEDAQYTADNEVDPRLGVKERYSQAIQYQLNAVTDYINSKEDKDTIYVLFGDHQPGLITKKEIGWDTPIHVISRDKKLIDQFLSFGFQPNMTGIQPGEFEFTHAGFFSHLMIAMSRCYAEGGREYEAFPFGLDLEEWFK